MYKGRAVLKGYFLLLFLFLSGCCCSNDVNLSYPTPSPMTQGALIGTAGGAAIGGIASGSGVGTVMGGVVGGMIGAAVGDSIERCQTLRDQLVAQGIQIIQVGDEVKIILPVDNYFHQNSPQLNSHYYSVLNKLAKFIRAFPKDSVKVSAYSDSADCENRSLALTRSQARAMASYLWRQGIDARMIYSAGYGPHFPVAHNQTTQGRSQNRRIEITFWRISPDDDI